MSEASVLQARLVGALFVERGLLTAEQLERALELQAERGELLGEILVTEFEISRIELASVLAEQWAELEQAETADTLQDRNEEPDQPRGTAATRRRIGEIFVERGFVDETALEEALDAQKESGQPLGEVLIGRGALSRLDLASALAEQWAGLEKIRPPAPKRVEGWQQGAPAEHAAAAAQGAARGAEAEAPVSALDASLVDAVTELGERVAAVEANGASDASADTLRASVESLTARLDGVEAGLAGGRQEPVDDEIHALRAALDDLRQRLAEPENRLGLVEGRVNELESDRTALGGVRSRLAALEKRIAEQASRDDLDGATGELSTRLDGLDARIDVAGTGAQSGLDAVLETLAEVRDRIDEVAASTQVGPHEHAEIAALEARLAEIARAGSAAEALAGRLESLEAVRDAMPWRHELSALQARLDELAPGAVDERVVERLAAVEVATPWRDDVSALQARLDELATSGGADDDQVERLAALEAAGAETPWREEISALRPQLDELASSVSTSVDDLARRLAAVEAEGSAAPWREEVAELQARLQKLAGSGPDVEAMIERLTALEARDPGTSVRTEVVALQEQLADLSASRAVAYGLVERVGTLETNAASAAWRDEVASLQARLDELGAAASAADGLAERLAALEATSLERPWRAELHRLAEELGMRLDGLGERLDEPGRVGPELEEVRAGLERLEGRLAQTAAAEHGHQEIADLQVRVEELAASNPADELGERLAAVEAGALERPWRKELLRLAEDVGGRLDALTGRLDGSETDDREQLEELRAAIEALAKRQKQSAKADHGHDEITALQTRFDELAETGSAVDELTERLTSVEAAGAATPWRADLSALRARLDDFGADLARVPREETAALRADLDALRAAAGDADRGAASRLAELSTRLDEIARATAELQAAEEAGASAVDRSELERVEHLVEEIGAAAREAARLAETAHAKNDERASADAAARESLDADQRRRIDSTAKKLRGDVSAVGSRVDALTESLATVTQTAVGTEQVETALATQEARLTERLGAYDEAIVQLRRRLEEIAALDGVLGERLATVEGGLGMRLDETVAALSGETASRQEALDALVAQMAGVEQHVSATPGALHMLHTELSTLASRLADVESAARAGSGWSEAVAAIGSRLAAVEKDVASRHDDPNGSRIDELERRLEAETAQADERTKVTERAIRKGLATLGERLAESESAYTEAGNALRRSIERLGRAIVETDAHLSTTDDPEAQVARETGAYVAFAPTPEGYRLIVVDGVLPQVGHTIELDGHESPLVVTRVGASPIPLDDRPCAYLERSGLTSE